MAHHTAPQRNLTRYAAPVSLTPALAFFASIQRAPQNFPEKFVAFNGKLVRSMQRTVEKTAAFGQKMVMYWVPGGREPQD